MNGNSLRKTAMHYGAMSGLGIFAVFLLIYFTGGNPLGPASWLGAWIPIPFIILATKHYRDDVLGGTISFGTAFLAGLLTVFFGAMLFDLLMYLFGTLADTGLLERYREEVQMGIEEAEKILSQDMIDTAMESLDKITMGSVATNDFLTKMIGGAILSLITAGIYKKSAPEI